MNSKRPNEGCTYFALSSNTYTTKDKLIDIGREDSSKKQRTIFSSSIIIDKLRGKGSLNKSPEGGPGKVPGTSARHGFPKQVPGPGEASGKVPGKGSWKGDSRKGSCSE